MVNTPRAIFFDFDLTLVNSLIPGTKSLEALKQDLKLDYHLVPWEQIWGSKLEDFMRQLVRVNHSSLSWQAVRQFNIQHMEIFYARCRLLGKKFLRYCRHHHLPLGIISNNAEEVIRATLAHSANRGIKFDVILSAGQLAGHTSKAAAIQLAMKQLHLRPTQVWYVGDHPNDIHFAREAGVTAVAVATGLYSMAQLKTYHPDIVVRQLNDLGKYFAKV